MLSKIDEFFLGMDHPFRLSSDVVYAMTDKQRKDIMSQLHDNYTWKGFYIGTGLTCVLFVAYIRLEVGYFPLDIGSVVGYSILTSGTSLLGGVIGTGLGSFFSISRGIWNGLISAKEI